MPDLPVIIDTNASTVLAELKSDFQTRTGRVLQDGQAETLLLSSWAYREGLLRAQIQNAACQNLVDFAIAPILDYLGRLVGVTRIPASQATTTIEFTLQSGHGGGIIPTGTRISSTDGKVIFLTVSPIDYTGLGNKVSILARCDTDGTIGNGYIAGTVVNLLNPMAVVVSVANTTTSSDGSAEETDDQLRERIKIASSSYSTAGSRQSYIFHAKSAHPSITDVVVLSPSPGSVVIYPKVAGGDVTSGTILSAVLVACSAETVRPLNDSVTTVSPTKLTYTLSIDIVTFTNADQALTLAAVEAALAALNVKKSEAMGQDVLTEHIIGACMVDGVYSVDVGSFTPITVDDTEFAFCTSITVAITGTTNG